MYTFGQLLRIQRNKNKLLQREVWETTGIPYSKISQYENDRQRPSPRNFKKLITLYKTEERPREYREITEAYEEIRLLSHSWRVIYDRDDKE